MITVLGIFKHQERRIKKYLLSFGHTNCMFVIFSMVAFIPIESNDIF